MHKEMDQNQGHEIDDRVYWDRYDPDAEDLISECTEWGDDACAMCTNRKCARADNL